MKLTVPTSCEVTATAIRIEVPLNYWDEEDERERLAGLPGVIETKKAKLVLTFDLETRKVRDWPEGRTTTAFYADIKVCDEGTYILLGMDGATEREVTRIENYVPDCIPQKYGDYVSFQIAPDGTILDASGGRWIPDAKAILAAFFRDTE